MSRRDEYDDERVVIVEQSTGSGIGMLLLGLAVGAGAALLFAPASGRETRERLQREARRAGRRVKEATEDLGEGLADRVERTYVRAPMKGVVNRVLVTTLGGVIKPGEAVLELVPSDDVLVVEAQVRPQDIGFVKIGQSANVKISAYDYSIFGSMSGQVTQISADAVSREERGQTVYYYIARIETQTSVMNSLGKKLPIIPGMQAQVDIITGNKSVLSYLLKPLIGVKENAFRER